MNRFLEITRKEIMNLSKYNKVHVVLGNESCDLDSAISALTYAYFLYLHLQNNTNTLPIPLLNINDEEFPLRTETKYFLRKQNICAANLTFRNNLNLTALRNEDKLMLTLVDHHVLPKTDSHLKSSVVEIIDHRPINKAEIACNNYFIQEVGSCCTLVAQRFLEENLMNQEVASLLYATIVLDTVNFNKEANRFKEMDIEVVQRLEKFKIDLERHKIHEELVTARSDISTLTSFQVLLKDMKVLDGVPLPGIPKLISSFIASKDASSAFIELCNKFSSKVIVPMGLHVDSGVVQREVAVFSTECCVLKDELVQVLRTNETLQLEEVTNGVEGLVLFKQNNVKMSRKHIVPILKGVISKYVKT